MGNLELILEKHTERISPRPRSTADLSMACQKVWEQAVTGELILRRMAGADGRDSRA